MRLIDADTVRRIIDSPRNKAQMLAMLEQTPTVDVIKCKDCKWFNDLGCAIQIIDDTDKPKENDFCSHAERRKDES